MYQYIKIMAYYYQYGIIVLMIVLAVVSAENIALHSDFVNQSSTLANDVSENGPKLAVDGINESSCSGMKYKGGAWWFIDLQQQYSLRYMKLFYRGYYIGSEPNISASVHIDDELCFQHSRTPAILATEHSVDCDRTLTGRYVNISFNIPDWVGGFGSIILCEVDIVVCARGTYGSDCNNFCHCSNLEECDVKTGKCPNGCQLGWYGDDCNTVTEGIMCKISTDSRNTTWSPVKAGTTSTNRCGDKYIGQSRRHCSEAGVWSQPDYSDCKLYKLVALKNITDGVIEGKLGTPPNEILQMLTELITDGPQLAAGDVEVSVQILKDVVAIANDSQVVFGKTELQKFALSASNILDADDEEWRTLAEQGKSGIAVMMDIVDSMANLGSSRLENNETITVSTDKMIIEIGRSSLSDIEFPRPASLDYPEWLTQSSNKVVLRNESLGEQNISYNVVFYNDISKIVEGRILNPGETIDSKSDKTVNINSKILAVSINPPPVGKLDPPIELSFQHLSDNYSGPTCVFLDLKPPFDKRGRWSTEGCKTESTSNPNVTICKCNHLTNFAILMSPGRTSIIHREVLSIISAVGCVISICCLSFTVFVYGYFWRYVKSDKAIILMNLCVTLIIALVLFLVGVNRTDSKVLCQTVAVLLHFFYLAVFFLMLAEGVQVLISVVTMAMTSRLKWILSASWGIPTILVIISMIATRLHGYGNDHYCWLSLESGLLWAFVGPALAVILINLIILVKVLTVMFSITIMVTKTMKEKGRTGLKALCILLPIIGLTWVFGVFSVNGYTVVFQYLFAIFNSLQGLFIFIFHCVLNRQVNDAFKIKRRRYRAKYIDTGTGTKSSIPMQTNQTRIMSDSDKPTNVPDEKKSPVQEAECQVHPQP